MNINILGRTGPRSLKGKANSSLNAVKHGGYAKTKILPFEDAAEHRRLERELYKSLMPSNALEESLVDQMVQSLWVTERFKWRLAQRQGSIFRQLSPAALAELIEVPETFRVFAPAYLKEPNTKFSKKDLKLPTQRYQQCLHLIRNSSGIKNYQMVFGPYQDLFQGMDDHFGKRLDSRIMMATGAGIEIFWQDNPRELEKLVVEYAAHLYYMVDFDELRPKIRFWMSTWFFLQRRDQRESDYQDDLVIKELNRFKSLLDSFLKLRKHTDERSRILEMKVLDLEHQNRRNELPNSEPESST